MFRFRFDPRLLTGALFCAFLLAGTALPTFAQESREDSRSEQREQEEAAREEALRQAREAAEQAQEAVRRAEEDMERAARLAEEESRRAARDAARDIRRTRRTPGIEVINDSLVIEEFDSEGAVLRRQGDGYELRVRDEDGDRDHTIQISIGQSSGSDGIVRFGEDIVIHEGEYVDGDVVAMGGDIICMGRIDGDCVAMGGDILLGDGAVVLGDVVCLGGTLTISDAVEIDGDAVSVWGGMEKSRLAEIDGEIVEVGGFAPIMWPNSPWGGDRGFLRGVSGMVQQVLWLALLTGLGVLIWVVFPTRMDRIAETVAKDSLKAFLAGLAGWVLWLPVFLALVITIIGALAAVALFFLTPLMVLFGYVAVSAVLGRGFSRRLGQTSPSRVRDIAVGVLALQSGILLGQFFGILGSGTLELIFCVVACTVISVAGTIGFGAIIMTRFRATSPEEFDDESADLPTPPTPPAAPSGGDEPKGTPLPTLDASG